MCRLLTYEYVGPFKFEYDETKSTNKTKPDIMNKMFCNVRRFLLEIKYSLISSLSIFSSTGRIGPTRTGLAFNT